MSTQRPFFANFFGAFRARTNPTFQAKSSAATSSISPTALSATAHVSTTTTNATPSSSRSITTSSDQPSQLNQHQISSTTTTSQSIPQSSNKPSTTFPSTFTSTSPGTHSFYPHSRSSGSSSPVPHNANLSISPPGQTTPMTRGRQRRGSDSSNSSGVFMDALASSEKWYIGGRTAGGDERFYRLGLVTNAQGKRTTSLDRLSL